MTSAQPGRSEDLDSRIVRYAWMMSIRIVCFVLAVVTPSPWRWMFIVAAVFLPYIAVVLANTQRTTKVTVRRRSWPGAACDRVAARGRHTAGSGPTTIDTEK